MNLPVAFRKQDLILEENVNDNLYTVVDNKDNFTSSAVKQIADFEICIDDHKILPDDVTINCTDIKFQRQVYNNNMMVPFYDKKEGKNAIFKELIPSDKIALKGFIFFPYLVNYSKLLLKNTNIYDRSLLHFNHTRLFQIFKTMRENQKFMGKNYVFDKDKKENFQKYFLKKNTHYEFQDQEEWNNKSVQNNKDNYKEFLENIIPNTRDIIDDVYTDLSNNYNWQTCYQKFVDKLEPYMIYNNDIEFYHYVRIQNYLRHSIQKYYQDIGFAYQSLNYFYTDIKSYNVNSPFFGFFKDDNAFNNIDCKCYDFKETETSVEYLNKIIQIDKSNLDSVINNESDKINAKIFSIGHRNPQGLTKINDSIFSVEHGPKGGDELNRILEEENYGWPKVTHGEEYGGGKIGKLTQKEFKDPKWIWVPSIAPSGMAFYNGNMFPELNDHLLIGSLKFKQIHAIKILNGHPVLERKLLNKSYGRVRDLEVMNDGSILFITDEDKSGRYKGGLYKIFKK